MQTDQRKALVDELLFLLNKGNAHVSFEDAVADFPKALRNLTPDTLPYNVWQLVEHIRITQWDIVQFCISAQHQSPPWPSGYWPKPSPKPIDDQAWEAALKQIAEDKKRLIALLNDTANDLFKPFAHGDGQNLLREAMLVADHTAYHTGEIVVVRRLLKAWK